VKTRSLALTLTAVLGIASVAGAFSTVLVTDEVGMRALAATDRRASIRGRVSSISIEHTHSDYNAHLHFEGVKDDRVVCFIGMADLFEPAYGANLTGLIGKTVEITSRASVQSGRIVFSASDYSDLKVIGSDPGLARITDQHHEQPEFAPAATAEERREVQELYSQAEADSLPAIEKLGLGYYSGTIGLRQDFTKSAEYFRLGLSHSGHCEGRSPSGGELCVDVSQISRVYLARQEEYGLGVEKDPNDAETLLVQAIALSEDKQVRLELFQEEQAVAKINLDASRQEEAERTRQFSTKEIIKRIFVTFAGVRVCNGFGQCVYRLRATTPEERKALSSPEGQQTIGAMVDQMDPSSAFSAASH